MKILHLYYDIMNLYGEYGNVCAVERIMQKSSVECEVDKITLGGNAELGEYDFIYMGSGTESNQKLVLKDFAKYKEQLKNCIENGKVILMTGNSFEMLGKSITDCEGHSYEGLGIFDFATVEQNKKRVTGDAIFSAEVTDKPLVGFINKCSETNGINAPLFNVKMGISNNSNSEYEGVHLNNFFGTHLTGPVLIKNPYFLAYIAELIMADSADFEAATDYLTYEKAGYEVTLRELTNRLENYN